MMKFYTCPTLAGCHLPLYKTDDGPVAGADSLNEAKDYMMKYLRKICEKYGYDMIEEKGVIKFKDTNEVYYISQIKEFNRSCRLEEWYKNRKGGYGVLQCI